MVLGLLACAAPPAGDAPAVDTRSGSPMGRSAMPRARRLTFDLLEVQVREEGLWVDLEFVNGSSHWYRTVVTRVTVHGPAGERVDQELPVGGLRSGQEKRVRVRFGEVPFDPIDVTVDLLYALP